MAKNFRKGSGLKSVENIVGKEKLLVMSNFSIFHSFFNRLLLQTCKNKGLLRKWLKDAV